MKTPKRIDRNVESILAEEREMFSRHARDLGISEKELALRKLHHKYPFAPKRRKENKKMKTFAMQLTILGRVPSKKNSRRAIYTGGRTIMIASKDYDAWHKDAASQLIGQCSAGSYDDDAQWRVEIIIFAPNKIRGDLTNKAESIMDLLVDCDILPDDNWTVVPHVILQFGGVDKVNPRAEVKVERITSKQS